MNKTRLTERELDVMQVLWRLETEASVAEVHKMLLSEGETLAYTTVQTMLNRLADKGQVVRQLEGRTYMYLPAVEAPAAKRSALYGLARRFFGGSVEELTAHLVQEVMSEAEINRVKKLLDQVRSADK